MAKNIAQPPAACKPHAGNSPLNFRRRPAANVNLEADVLGKRVEKLLARRLIAELN